MKKISIFGSTGSIGSSAISIIEQFPEKFQIVGLSARSQLEKLRIQAETFRVPYLVVENEESRHWLLRHLNYRPEILVGDEGLILLSQLEDLEILIVGITGIKGLIPAYYGLLAGKRVALANKESLVCAGDLINQAIKAGCGELIPVDSEHSSLFQLFCCEKRSYIRKLILTASGGPFWQWPKEAFENITPEMALKHPTWRMGPKITIDSATLMNKGFEVIEAHQLFGFPPEAIEVLIHPQSVVHALVETVDGALFAHLSLTDMRLPIAYALSYPERWNLPLRPLNLSEISGLSFHPVDFEKFPCLRLAYDALNAGFPYPLILEASDEVLVEAFLEGKIGFTEIPLFLEKTLNEFKFTEGNCKTVEEVLTLHSKVKDFTLNLLKMRQSR